MLAIGLGTCRSHQLAHALGVQFYLWHRLAEQLRPLLIVRPAECQPAVPLAAGSPGPGRQGRFVMNRTAMRRPLAEGRQFAEATC